MAFKDIPSLLDSEYPSEKVWEHPKTKQKYIDDNFKGYKLEKVSIDDLIRDNDLNNPIALNNHPETWSPTGNEEDIDPSKFQYNAELDNSNSSIINATRRANGQLRLNDGRHRIRALKNGGYTHALLPIIDENK